MQAFYLKTKYNHKKNKYIIKTPSATTVAKKTCQINSRV